MNPVIKNYERGRCKIYDGLCRLQELGIVESFDEPIIHRGTNALIHRFKVGEYNRYLHYTRYNGRVLAFRQHLTHNDKGAYFEGLSPEEWLSAFDSETRKALLFNLDLWT
jgi:hypothetical protein